MNPTPPPTSPPPGPGEIPALISLLHETSQRLEELTSGEIDTVADAAGRTFVLRRAQEELRRSESTRQAAILDALPAHIALLDAAGVVVSVNEGWRRFADANGLAAAGYGIGLDYLAICDHASRESSSTPQQAAEAIRGVLTGARESTSIEYPCHSPAEKRWFLMTATPLLAERSGGVVIMHFDVTERKLAEEALLRNEQEFRAMFELASVGIAQADPLTSRLLRVNGKMCQITGYSADEMVGMRISELTHPEDRAADAEELRRALLPGSPDYRMEKRYIRKDGSIVWANVNVTVIRGAAQEAVRVMAAIEDITERKRSEERAERALQRLTEAQRIGQIGDWEWDLATQAITWSPQAFEILGRDPRLGPPTYMENNAMYEEASQSVMAENVARVLETGNPQEYELRARRPNGVGVDVLARAAARKDGNGRVVGLYGTVQDITARKRSEAAVRESDLRYQSLFENMLEGYAYCATIFEQDRLTDFTYLEVNSAFETLTGLKDVIGKNVSEVLPAEMEANLGLLELFGRVARSGEPEKHEAYLESLRIWLSITAYSSDRGHFVAVFDNITTRKRADETSRRSAEELQVERGRLVTAQQVAKVGSWETDLSTGRVVWSEETHRIYETDAATFHPTHPVFLGLVHPDDRDRVAAAFANSMDERSPSAIEHRILLDDGRIKFVEERWQVQRHPLGRALRATGTCQDITERKITEQKIAHLSRVHAMLSGINTLIVRVRDREELFEEACRIAVDAGGFRMSLIAVVDPQTEAIVPVASAGKDEGLLAEVAQALSNPETARRSMVAGAMRGKAPVVSNDSMGDPRLLLPKRYVESEVRSIAVLPLLIGGEAVGVLALYSGEVDFFHEKEMKLLTELANDIAFCMGALRARAHKEKAEEALRASLKEKEALLKEVHHRVKNNMQVITSLLRLEANRIDHPTTRGVLKDMQNRIQAMAALHEALYRSNNFAQVELSSYLRDLTGQLARSLVASPGQVRFVLDLFPVGLDLDQAVPCGLLVNELVSNAIKHAFPAGGSGEVRVGMEWAEGGLLRLRVSDNGVGLAQDFEARREKSLGLQLVSDLARQLGGTFRIGAGPAAVFEVTFAVASHAEGSPPVAHPRDVPVVPA